MERVLNEFCIVDIDDRVALVNSGPAGAVVGLFGFSFRAVRSVRHAVATASPRSATETRVNFILLYPQVAITA